MIKHLSIAFALLGLSITCWADTLASETEVRQLSEKVMKEVATGDLSAAFAAMQPYIVFPEEEFQDLVLTTKSQRAKFGTRYGKSVGYALIGEKKASDSILRITYIEKTEKHALPWSFYFYKSPTGWVLNSFFWNAQITTAFE